MNSKNSNSENEKVSQIFHSQNVQNETVNNFKHDEFNHDLTGFSPSHIKEIKEPYIIKVKGDSMEPHIKHDDDIIINFYSDVDNNDIAAVWLNGKCMIKVFCKNNWELILKSINPNYKDIKISEEDDFQILGKVTLSKKKGNK